MQDIALPSTRDYRHLLERKLYLRVLVPAACGLLILPIALYDSVAHGMTLVSIAWWFIGGAVLGFLPARMMRVRRDVQRQLIVLSEGQATAVIFYLVARGISDLYIGWVADSTVILIDAFLLCTAGSLLGLSAGLARNIRRQF